MNNTYVTTVGSDEMLQLSNEVMDALEVKPGDKVIVDYSGDVATVRPYIENEV